MQKSLTAGKLVFQPYIRRNKIEFLELRQRDKKKKEREKDITTASLSAVISLDFHSEAKTRRCFLTRKLSRVKRNLKNKKIQDHSCIRLGLNFYRLNFSPFSPLLFEGFFERLNRNFASDEILVSFSLWITRETAALEKRSMELVSAPTKIILSQHEEKRRSANIYRSYEHRRRLGVVRCVLLVDTFLHFHHLK